MSVDFNRMRTELEKDEGRVSWAYPDHLGFLTIGIGRLIDHRKGGGLSNDEIDYLLSNDINKRLVQIEKYPWFLACDTDARRRALLNMSFQLGVEGLLAFKNSLAFITEKKWELAGENLRKSKWYTQTPLRAERVIRQIETGSDE